MKKPRGEKGGKDRYRELAEADERDNRLREKKFRLQPESVEPDIQAGERRVLHATEGLSPDELAAATLAAAEARAEAAAAAREATAEIDEALAELAEKKAAEMKADPLRKSLVRLSEGRITDIAPGDIIYKVTFTYNKGPLEIRANTYHEFLQQISELSSDGQRSLFSGKPGVDVIYKVVVNPNLYNRLGVVAEKKFSAIRLRLLESLGSIGDETDPELSKQIAAMRSQYRTVKTRTPREKAVVAPQATETNPLGIEGIEAPAPASAPSPESPLPSAEDVAQQILRGEPVGEIMPTLTEETRKEIARRVVEEYGNRRKTKEQERSREQELQAQREAIQNATTLDELYKKIESVQTLRSGGVEYSSKELVAEMQKLGEQALLGALPSATELQKIPRGDRGENLRQKFTELLKTDWARRTLSETSFQESKDLHELPLNQHTAEGFTIRGKKRSVVIIKEEFIDDRRKPQKPLSKKRFWSKFLRLKT